MRLFRLMTFFDPNTQNVAIPTNAPREVIFDPISMASNGKKTTYHNFFMCSSDANNVKVKFLVVFIFAIKL